MNIQVSPGVFETLTAQALVSRYPDDRRFLLEIRGNYQAATDRFERDLKQKESRFYEAAVHLITRKISRITSSTGIS